MLALKPKNHIVLPRFELRLPKPMQLSPVPVTDGEDEQIAEQLDNRWQLEERPDPGQLEAFWSKVVDDLQHDPEWVNFGADDQSAPGAFF